MMKKKVSLKDIAKEVGVSIALVSYVINNKEKEARVGADVANKIREAVKKLNYQTNQVAKSLKVGKSQILGLIVADISNPFFANIARTIEDEAKKHNYTVIFGSSDEDDDKSWNLIEVLLRQQVDGIIIAPTINSENQIRHLEEQHIPYVLIDRYFPSINSNYVVTDNYQAAYHAVKHLLVTNHHKIGLIVYESSLHHMVERKQGYIDAVKELSSKPGHLLIREVNILNVKEDVEHAMLSLINDHQIDALFFATNTLSITGLNFLNKSNLKVPDDIAVVCFDESEVFDFFYSPITFVNQPLLDVGKNAVKILINQISGAKGGISQIVLKSNLVIGKSSGA